MNPLFKLNNFTPGPQHYETTTNVDELETEEEPRPLQTAPRFVGNSYRGYGIRLILNYSLEKKPDVPAATKYSLSRFGDKIQVSYYQNPSQKPMNHRKILTISQGKCNFVFVCLQLRAFCF